MGDNNPETADPPDGIIPAAGPMAYRVHGANGYDAGNLLTLEYLTWRIDGHNTFDPPGRSKPEILKRDYNLDGLLDMGEV